MRSVLRCSFSRVRDSFRLGDGFFSSVNSYNAFLYGGAEDAGSLSGILSRFLRVSDSYGFVELEYVSHSFVEPTFSVSECKRKLLTYALSLYVEVRMIIYDVDEAKQTRSVRAIKEEKVYLCDLPKIVGNGIFIINGIEKVVVGQIRRSPGVFFSRANGTNGVPHCYAEIRPSYGNKVEYEVSGSGCFCKVGRYRRFEVYYFLRAVGLSDREIVARMFSGIALEYCGNKKCSLRFDFGGACGRIFGLNVRDTDGSIVVRAGSLVTKQLLRKLSKIESLYCTFEDLVGSYYCDASANEKDPCLGVVDENFLESLEKGESFSVVDRGCETFSGVFLDCVMSHIGLSDEKVLVHLMNIFRPSYPFVLEEARDYFGKLFFSEELFSLSEVGRFRMNEVLKINVPSDFCALCTDDIVETLRCLFAYRNGSFFVDDVDSLSNRRIRTTGEIVGSVFMASIMKVAKNAVERLNGLIIDNATVGDFISSAIVSRDVNDFFTLSELCQFMEQTNILSEITHIRKVTALGDGGIKKETATASIRDIHDSHYGRICPIETPDGGNIGLVVSLACFAKVNKYGFVEVPYRKVVDGKLTDEIVYLGVRDERQKRIADLGEFLSKCSNQDNIVSVRFNGDVVSSRVSDVDFVSVVVCHITSAMSFFIPFIESNDTARALMGCNMQRQAVPLLFRQAPFVGTGMEREIGRVSSDVIKAELDGVVDYADARMVVVRGAEKYAVHFLKNFARTNQDMMSHHTPVVSVGQRVQAGDILADVASTSRGEVAIGKNILVGFVPWNGYNYEDSVVISRKLVSDDAFTSVHIHEFEIQVRDTQLGAEETTNNLDDVAFDRLAHLDESGIVHIGAVVKSGDILVGKVTPVGEKFSSSEDRLIQAIFGDVDGRKKNTSLYVPFGIAGVVVGVDILTKRGEMKDDRALQIEAEKIKQRKKLLELEKKELLDVFKDNTNSPAYIKAKKEIEDRCANDIGIIMDGDVLPNSVLKIVKVSVAVRSRLQVGDKISGRHGNKGVIARCVAVEDMPYLEDGTPLDLVFSPVSIPGRMNIGQVLETHLGFLSYNIGRKIDEALMAQNAAQNVREILKKVSIRDDAFVEKVNSMSDEEVVEFAKDRKRGVFFETPIFDGAKIDDMEELAQRFGIDKSLQVRLYNGLTGEPFDRKITVGYMYILKLHHLVDEKVYARSTGSYSLVTQQPLGGRSYGGGQRFGEMECWALQAYGAAYSLQEMMTVKSDDVSGRKKMYESIIEGGTRFKSGIPETFNILCREMRSLGFDVELGLVG